MLLERKFTLKNGEIIDERRVETTEDFTRKLRLYECPRCHADTFGRFEPFIPMQIDAWCSNCGYTFSRDVEARSRYIKEHNVPIEQPSTTYYVTLDDEDTPDEI